MFPFVEYIKSYVDLPKDVENEIIDKLKFQTFEKGDLIIKSKRVCNRIYFLEQGTIRSYFFRGTKEITHWIYNEDQIVMAWNSFINQTEATDSFEAVEVCKMSSLTYEEWQELLSKHTIIDHFYRRILEEQMAAIDEFYKGYFFMTAKEKYDLLIAAFPSVTQIANLKHIASMLGISQETLSRIRGIR